MIEGILNVISNVGHINSFRMFRHILVNALIFSVCTISAQSVHIGRNHIIRNKLDLKGDTLKLPQGTRLYFENGACISNGGLLGSDTSISGNIDKIFNQVQISGTWNVLKISTCMFIDIHRDNALKELFALTSPRVRNQVTIESGDYWLSASSDWQAQVQVNSNTEIILEGTVRLRPNKCKGYKMFNLQGDNIYLYGGGTIIGDREHHLGNEGEWGMGVNISTGSNIQISGLTISDCWGDCIYVGGNVKDVKISRCFLVGGRRQGISITAARRVCIEDCTIRNIAGTAPEYAIDVEPNSSDTVDYVLIKNVKAIDCNGGYMSWHPNKDSYIGTIEIQNCSVLGRVKHYDYSFERTKKVIMKNNQGVEKKIRLIANALVKLENNSIKNQKNSSYLISNCKQVKKK